MSSQSVTNLRHNGLIVTLTTGELRALIRQEVQAVLTTPIRNSNTASKPYLTVREAGELSRLGTSTIRLYIRKRQLRAQKVGRRVIISSGDLETFLARNPIEIRAN